MEEAKPNSQQAVCDIVDWAMSGNKSLLVHGLNSKPSFGHAVAADAAMDMTGLNGITLYEPEELVLTAKAGTPLATIEKLVHASNQQLEFEPPDLSAIFHRNAGKGTIGGVLNTGLAGPRRLRSGSVRDHVLGIKAVSGRAQTFVSGGRVVKNVTGYDLSKGLTGSFGTLAVLTEVTFKVMPRPETSASLILSGLDTAGAVAAMTKAMGTSCEVSSAAHLPQGGIEGLPGHGATVLRLEGFVPSVKARLDRLAGELHDFGPVERLEQAQSESVWRAVRDLAPFASAADERPLWRISVAPSAGVTIASAAEALGAAWFMDWSGGLVWVEMPPGDEADMAGAVSDAGASVLRDAVLRAGGGHATLLRADQAIRAKVSVFQPQPAPLAALSKRLKAGFDPLGILNPGRMVAI